MLAKLWILTMLLVLSAVVPATVSGQQESGDIDLSGTVAGNAPAQPAVITRPADGQHFSTNQVTVAGTCPDNGAYVHIMRNDVFAGSAVCQNGEFKLTVTLLPGENRLLARIFSSDNQRGPDSDTVTVFYDIPGDEPAAPGPAGGGISPLILLTEPIYPGGYVQKQLTISVEILGGEGPYAVSIDWGDGNNDLLVRLEDGKFDVSHIYTEAGTYEVLISASDTEGREASIQTIIIVSGEPARIELDTFIDRHAKSLWVRIIGPIMLILITYIAGLITGLKIVGDELKRDQLNR